MPLSRRAKILCSIAITALFLFNASYALDGLHVSSASSTNTAITSVLGGPNTSNTTDTNPSDASYGPHIAVGHPPTTFGSHPLNFGSYCVSNVNDVCSGGAITDLYSTQIALQASIEAEGCGGCSNGQYEGGWVSYPMTLSNGTVFWAQDGFLTIYGQASVYFFAQVWNLNTGHEVWYNNQITTLTVGNSYDFKITANQNGNNEFIFDIGNNCPCAFYTIQGATMTGPDTGYNNGVGNWVAFEEQPSMHSDSTEVTFQSMSSYLCTPSCSWANWGWGQTQQGYPSSYAIEYHNYNSGIPVDTFYVNTGSNFPGAGTCMWGSC
jgi:hypothetical protein